MVSYASGVRDCVLALLVSDEQTQIEFLKSFLGCPTRACAFWGLDSECVLWSVIETGQGFGWGHHPRANSDTALQQAHSIYSHEGVIVMREINRVQLHNQESHNQESRIQQLQKK